MLCLTSVCIVCIAVNSQCLRGEWGFWVVVSCLGVFLFFSILKYLLDVVISYALQSFPRNDKLHLIGSFWVWHWYLYHQYHACRDFFSNVFFFLLLNNHHDFGGFFSLTFHLTFPAILVADKDLGDVQWLSIQTHRHTHLYCDRKFRLSFGLLYILETVTKVFFIFINYKSKKGHFKLTSLWYLLIFKTKYCTHLFLEAILPAWGSHWGLQWLFALFSRQLLFSTR